jgi:nuclear cap-binding protein subunit 1
LLELPHKAELMATLCGVLNVGNREIVALCLDRLNSHLSGDLKWWQLVQIPRVMVELTNTKVISITKLNDFMTETCEKIIGKSENGELVAIAVLLALPWLSSENLTNFSFALDRIEALVNESERFTNISKSFDVKIEGFEAFNGDALKALLEAVKNLNGPAKNLRTEPYKTFEGSLMESKAHEDFSVAWTVEIVESVHVSEFKPLEIFSDAFEVECANEFSRIYYQFMLHMLIEAYELNHRRGAEVMFSCFPEGSGVNVEKVICQVLFGKLLRSRLRTSITYYEVLLIDSCRLSRMFPPMMARSLIKLVSRLDEKAADLEVLERLAGWFAHHLSHYDFKWNWTEWKEIVENDKEINCKRIFLRFLIYKLLLLSYQEKMQAVLPDFMLKMMPSMSSACKTSNSFNEELLEFMKKRPSIEEVREHAAREGVQLQDLFEVFLFLGSKTFSHLSSVTDRYASLFRSASVENQKLFINCVSQFWADNIQNFHLVLEKLVQYEILDENVLLEFLFEKLENSEGFEVQILLKFFSSEFLLTLISMKEGKDGKVQLVRNLIDRFSSLDLSATSTSHWIIWLSSGLVKKFLRSFFADKSFALVQKTETLISMLETCENEKVKEMLEGTYKSITL